ncbi:MAG: T9SS type A sorting domain-containing protein [Sphingobacteriales bacterium]|nr:MAG: T9SS type A sorting domain-containing protein [Sphingobacteriales bacterium]
MFRKLLPLFALCFTTYTQAQTLYPGGIPNCIARYDMNTAAGTTSVTNVADVSGNGNNSYSVNNISAGADFRGVPNKSILFDANLESGIRIATSATLETTNQITMLAVVRIDSFYAGTCQNTCILNKGTVDLTPGNYYMRLSDNPTDHDNCFAYDATTHQAQGVFGSAYYYDQPNIPYVPEGKWYFVAVAYDGAEARIYEIPLEGDGEEEIFAPVSTYPVSGGMGSNSYDLTIGMMPLSTHPYWFTGAMDEVALFDRGLSNSELSGVYRYLRNATLSVADVAAIDEMVTYPNPATNVLNLQCKLNASTAQLEVYNAMGQKLLAENVTTTGGNLQYSMNTSNLPAGIYTLKLTAGGAVKTMRFTVQR